MRKAVSGTDSIRSGDEKRQKRGQKINFSYFLSGFLCRRGCGLRDGRAEEEAGKDGTKAPRRAAGTVRRMGRKNITIHKTIKIN